jgi:hypothetical protein
MHEALCKILKILPGCQWRGKSAEHLMEGNPAKLHWRVQGCINLFTNVCNQFHNKEDITHNTYVACMSKDAIWVWCHVKFHSHLTNQISVIELQEEPGDPVCNFCSFHARSNASGKQRFLLGCNLSAFTF